MLHTIPDCNRQRLTKYCHGQHFTSYLNPGTLLLNNCLSVSLESARQCNRPAVRQTTLFALHRKLPIHVFSCLLDVLTDSCSVLLIGSTEEWNGKYVRLNLSSLIRWTHVLTHIIVHAKA